MIKARRYSIQIKDAESSATLLFVAAEWTEEQLDFAITQNIRLAGPQDGNRSTAPNPSEKHASG
jgi:hypothetical protein